MSPFFFCALFGEVPRGIIPFGGALFEVFEAARKHAMRSPPGKRYGIGFTPGIAEKAQTTTIPPEEPGAAGVRDLRCRRRGKRCESKMGHQSQASPVMLTSDQSEEQKSGVVPF